MTPKNKAKELFLKFNNATLAYDSGDNTAEGINESIMLMVKESKRCALIAVDEIINSCPIEPSNTDWDDCGGSFQYWYPQKREDSLIFWEKVKQELEKL